MLEPVFAAQPETTFAKTRIYLSVCPGAKPETTFAEHARRGEYCSFRLKAGKGRQPISSPSGWPFFMAPAF